MRVTDTLVRLGVVVALCLGAIAISAATAPAQSGLGEGLKPVGFVPYTNGSHLALATIEGRDYAFAAEQGSAVGKVRVIDVTQPTRPRVLDEIQCGTGQGNVQITPDKKTLVLGLDGGANGGICALGQPGFATIDISNPARLRPVGFAVNPRGSHSLAMHPTEPIVYNGSGFPEPNGEMEIWSL